MKGVRREESGEEEGRGKSRRNTQFIIRYLFFMSSDALIFN